MRAHALVVALALVGGCCATPDPAEVALLHQELDLLGDMARAPGDRTTRQISAITACVSSAQAHVRSIAHEAAAK